MSFKRTAGTELNHDNWNEEEETEEKGEFKKASDDVLAKRVRKVAKRRGVAGEGESTPAISNPFSGFGGFGTKPSVAASTPISAASTPFSFLSKIPSVGSLAASSTTTTFTTAATKKPNGESISTQSTSGECITNGSSSNNNMEYFSQIKSLNVAFIGWIKEKVDENPLCDLSPIFKDYANYMKDISKIKQEAKPDDAEKKEEEKPKSTAAPATNFTFGKPASTTSSSPPSTNIFASVNTSSIFSSTAKPDAPKETSPAKPATENKGFSFGLTQPTAPPAFSFGLQKPAAGASIFGNSSSFSFGNVTQTKSETEIKPAEAEGEGETEDEPPKNEFVPVVEEDSLFSKRCKVFVKSGNDYADRGVGTLFLKKVDDKVQLVVRADTNLGNILLNIILQEGLPTSRLGKNNVMIVCVPMPDSKPPPIPVLVRVKTAEEADELLSILEKYKKGAD